MDFEPGLKVIVTGVTPYEETEGCKGVLIRRGKFHDWLVAVTFPDGSHDELGYDEHELTLLNSTEENKASWEQYINRHDEP